MDNQLTRKSFFLLFISCLAIIFLKELHLVVQTISTWHHSLSHLFASIFSGGQIGTFIRQTLALLIIPLAIGLTTGGVYWLIRRKQMPYLFELVGVIWIILTTTMALYR